MNNEVVIVGACRTPIGSFLGSLQDVHVKELGRIVGTEALGVQGSAPKTLMKSSAAT